MRPEKMFRKLSRWIVFFLLLSVVLAPATFTAKSQEEVESAWGPYLTLKDDQTIAVNWKTSRPTSGIVNYDRERFYLDHEKMRQRTEERGEKEVFHHLELNELTPGELHVYSIGKVSGAGDINYFGSPRKNPDNFSFFVYGDSRTCPERHRRVASEMALDPFDTSFIFNTGDLIESPANDNWEDFFWAIEPFSKSTPILPVLGNHERNDESYYRAFDLPSGGGDFGQQWYSFSYGRVRFIVLDSNENFMTRSEFRKEREWLLNELESNSKPFTVVVFHHPIFSSVYSSEIDEDLASSWGSLFEKYEVDLVFNGHVHSYERLVNNGVTYVVTGGGGAPTDNLSQRLDASRKALGDSLHFIRVSVEETKLRLQMVEVAEVVRGNHSGRVGCSANLEANRRIRDEVVIEID